MMPQFERAQHGKFHVSKIFRWPFFADRCGITLSDATSFGAAEMPHAIIVSRAQEARAV